MPTEGQMPDLLAELLENGVITQAEYDAIAAYVAAQATAA